MKRILIALTGMLLIGLGMASAQIVTPLQFAVDSPFYAANALLPAGTYQVIPAAEEGLVEIRGLSTHKSGLIMTMRRVNLTLPKESTVVFDRYGDTLVLKTIIEEAETDGVTAIPSAVEKREEKASGPAAQVVIPAVRVSKKA